MAELIHNASSSFFSAKARKKMTMLDVGCGTGLSAEPFWDQHSVHGVDGSSAMIAKIPNPQFRSRVLRMDFNMVTGNSFEHGLPYTKDMFDVVYSVGALSYVRPYSPLFDNMIRVAKPGGLIAIATETDTTLSPNIFLKKQLRDSKGRFSDLHRIYAADTLANFMEGAGAEHISSSVRVGFVNELGHDVPYAFQLYQKPR